MKTSRIISMFSKLFPAALMLMLLVVLAGPAYPKISTNDFGSFIVQGESIDIVSTKVVQNGGRVTSRLPIIKGVAAVLPASSIRLLLADSEITAVTPNADVQMAQDTVIAPSDYIEAVGAEVVWKDGASGNGITVAVVDTGIGNLQGLLRDTSGKKGRLVGWIDFVEGLPNPKDRNGHGTHVAAIIANTDTGGDGEWNGVAPGVNLVGVRVLNEEGRGTYESVIQGIQWVVENQARYNIRVMNLSLVSQALSPYWADPLNQAAMVAWAEGITVVASSGNGGPGPMTIGVPGNNPYLITVGSFTDNYTPVDWQDDYLAPFSAAGPTLDGFVKPDLVAPGAHIVSLMNPGTYTARSHPENKITEQYFSMAGTSQSAAVVSGIAALILEKNPAATPENVKFRLMVTAFPWVDQASREAGYSMWQQGAGRANAPDAVFADIAGEANYGMDIQADLQGEQHYQGFTYFDEDSGVFKLEDFEEAGYGSWAGGYGSWAGGYGSWAGGYGSWAGGYGSWAGGYGSWAGGYGSWAGGYGSWAGGYGSWAGGYGSWAGGYGSWAGGYGSWAGGYGSWAGGYGSWAGSLPWSDTILMDVEFVENFVEGVSPDMESMIPSISDWIEEP